MHNYSIILFIFAALLHKYTSMSTKKERLDAICRIIQTEKIGNQEELLKQLENSGFQVTQATLSRDIKQLKVIKLCISPARLFSTYATSERANAVSSQHRVFG